MKTLLLIPALMLAWSVSAQDGNRQQSTPASDLVGQIYKETDVKKKEALLARFKSEFPDESLDGAYGGMVYTLAKEAEHAEEAIRYTELIKDRNQRFINVFHTSVNIATRAPELAKPYLKAKLAEFADLENPPKSEDQTQQQRNDQSKMMFNSIKYAYGELLVKDGNYTEALSYVQQGYESQVRKNPEHSAFLADLLIKNGKPEAAFPLLDELMKGGRANPAIKKQLAEVYTKLHPGKDAGAYVAGIEQQVMAKIGNDFMKHAVNKPAPAFEVLDVDGNKVTLADFKGKTIVLDFWATWCGPCKKSFPGMQRVVNRYKSDPNVKFLFIHTWETVDDPLTDAKNYLTANNYDFDLYIDPKSGDSNLSVTMFGVRGIPAKFVIDRHGNIRFGGSGSGGGEDAAVEELTLMIEYVKNNS